MMLVDCSKEWGLLEAQGSKYIFNRAKYILSFLHGAKLPTSRK